MLPEDTALPQSGLKHCLAVSPRLRRGDSEFVAAAASQ